MWLLLWIATWLSSLTAFAVSDGHADLMARDSTLTGAGVNIAQVEFLNNQTPKRFEADFSQTTATGTYFDGNDPYPTGRTTPINPGLFSNHANSVADEIYDTLLGFAPDISSVQNFEVNHYINDIIPVATATGVPIVNQSFVFGNVNSTWDSFYDSYADQHDVLFLNGINTNVSPATVDTPGHSYNGLAVGSLSFSVSPPADGRNKPDLVSLTYDSAEKSSFTTARVTAFAAILHQAGTRGDQASGSAAEATDAKTKKVLLINGADKPVSWSKTIDYDDAVSLPVTHTSPLDSNIGAGVANINFAHLNLEGGLHLPTVEESVDAGGLHSPPTGIPGNLPSKVGWNLDALSTAGQVINLKDGVHHYYFDWTPGEGQAFDLTATITWNRQDGKTGINNLDLYVYEEDGSSYNLVAASESSVDNVEHLHILDMPTGRYVIQVVSRRSGRVTSSEEYALAFRMEAVDPPADPTNFMATVISDTQIDLSWTDNATDEDEYVLERSLQSDFSSIEATFNLAADSISYSDTGLTPGVLYYYRLAASNAGGPSNTVSDSGETFSAPEAPTNFQGAGVSETQISLSWTDNADNEDEYIVERSTTQGSGYATIATLNPDVVSYSDSIGLTEGTEYFYRLTAVNNYGASATVETQATTLDVPSVPTGLTVTALSQTEIDLSWTDNSANETGYRVERSLNESSGFADISGNLAPDTESYSDTGLQSGVTYYYRVQAFNADGDSEFAAGNTTTWTEREQWRFDNFGIITNTGDAADTENPDEDDGDNQTEYALGTDPNASGESVSSRVSTDFHNDGIDDYLMIRIVRDQKRADVTYRVQSSGEPGNGFSDQTVTVLTDTDTLLEVRDNTPMDTADRRFIKFDVTP